MSSRLRRWARGSFRAHADGIAPSSTLNGHGPAGNGRPGPSDDDNVVDITLARHDDSESLAAEERNAAAWRIAAFAASASGQLLAIVAGVSLAPLPGSSAVVLGVALVLAVAIGTAFGSGSSTLRVADDLAPTVIAVSVATTATALARPGTAEAHHFVQGAVASLGLVLIARAAVYAVRRLLRRRRVGLASTVIVGAGHVGKSVASALMTNPEHGFEPIGFLDDPLEQGEQLPLPMLGHPEKLPEVMRAHNARHVIIAFGLARESEIVPMLRNWDWVPGDVYILPRFFELGSHHHGGDSVDLRGYPVIRLRAPAAHQTLWPLKRAFDIAVAGIMLALVAPALALGALAVRLSGPGPILFRQERVGQGGRKFEILKFRTMPVNNDSDTTWNVEKDDRMGRIGAIMRRTHLDELPQLFNVLRGEMSIVGPRPERPFFVEQFEAEIEDYVERHRVPVGITGWAQVHGLFGDTSIEERARYDNRYIDQWSLWKDFSILFRTVPTVLKRRKKKG